MNTKKFLVILLTTILCFSFVVTSAWAGATQRHRWEGVAIGLGIAIVGNALLNDYYYPRPSPTVVYYSAPCVVRCCPPPARSHGHYRHPKPHHRHHHGHW